MNRKTIFLLIFVLISFQLFSSIFQNEKKDTFFLQKKINIIFSIESYLKKNKWTPILISIRDLNFFLWMDENGRVNEYPEIVNLKKKPIFTIDFLSKTIFIDKQYFSFDIYEQNHIRTRIKLIRENEPVILKIHPYNRQVDFYIGQSKLNIDTIKADFMETFPGFYEIKFIGRSVFSYSDFILERENGIIYSTNYKKIANKFNKNVWAKKRVDLGEQK